MKKKAVSILLTVTMAAAMLSGCGNNAGSASGDASASSDGAATESGKAATEDFSNIKVGAIGSFGKDDGGWTQAQYTGIVNALSELGISEDNLEFVDNVAETGTDFTNAAEGLVADGCNIIIGASTGYKSAIEELSSKYPDIQFAQADGTLMNGNLCGYQIRSYEGMFLCGYISALMSDQDDLGYSAGQPEASVIQGINAFALGAKYANPNATVRVVWANSWYDPTAEADCANSLISLGIKCIGINASSPAIPQACEAAKVLCTGYHVDMKDYAPDAVMVSYMWNWAPIFEDIIEQYAADGTPKDTSYYWGAEENCSTISDINMDIVPQDVADKVHDVQQKIASGELDVLAGEIKDNQGNVIVKEGETMSDEVNRSMDFLVDNVIGQLP